ncbi:unnamed protein product [Brassica rapa subsp. trilocularis]
MGVRVPVWVSVRVGCFGFSDEEVQNLFGFFYTSDRVRVISGITELCNK